MDSITLPILDIFISSLFLLLSLTHSLSLSLSPSLSLSIYIYNLKPPLRTGCDSMSISKWSLAGLDSQFSFS